MPSKPDSFHGDLEFVKSRAGVIFDRETGATIGKCGFKGPPSDGRVEIGGFALLRPGHS